ncbi:hypothetical protein MMC07_006378 [Pseudocyphellaria aurata]|nr:hypothetical protein [Pseudocyphellaria aurata]
MHFTTFLVAAAALCATSASGECFNTGQNWGDHAVAKAKLAEACGEELARDYGSNDAHQKCKDNSAGNESYVFRIENHTGGGIQVSYDECVREIGAQIDNCGHGGAVTHAGVYYRGDPNKGSC